MVALEAFPHIIAICQVRGAFYGDLVVIIENNQLFEPQVTCKCEGFVTDSFHQTEIK